MIQISDLTKGYGDQLLLDGVSFNINAGEKIGVVGRNGHGKTTLFRLILGTEEADRGTITFPKNYTIGYLEQHVSIKSLSILDEVCSGLRPEHSADRWRAEKLLSGLGFAASEFGRSPSEYSGGFQMRVMLAKVLAGEPDLLLLDEPTNYLDIVTLRWLERFLNDWKGELMLITHDRSFMDRVCTHTLAIHRQKARKIEGGTDKLYEQIAQEEEIYEKTRLNDEKRRKEVELFITRFRAKARLGAMVQSRIKMLEKQDQKQKLDNIQDLEFSFNEAPFTGKWTVEAKGVSFGYPGQPDLIRNFSLTVNASDRIGIIGKNGKGKSTLLKLLAGILMPKQGDIKTHPQLKTGYFGQTNIECLHPENTVEEEILNADPERRRQLARNIAGSMMFEGDMALKQVRVLSGGEKSRVMLGKIVISPCQMLLLDEPTNHLDMQSCDSLIEALNSFGGALAIVTHNEMYLKSLCNRLVVLDRGQITVFEGGYQEFLNTVGWEGEDAPKMADVPSENNRKAQRKERAELLTEKNKLQKPLKQKMTSLEAEIQKLETESAADNDALVEAASKGDGPKIAELSKKLKADQERLSQAYDELAEVSDRFDAIETDFREKM